MPTNLRPAAVAGTFYPKEASELLQTVRNLLSKAAQTPDIPQFNNPPKAIIVPHAGYIYSGAVAASAYAILLRFRSKINRIILLGPAHREAVNGIAVPETDFFETPLGPIPIDQNARQRLRPFHYVHSADSPHRLEHSLEVQLPFLQLILGQFSLLPLLVGQASPEEVDQIIEEFWDEPETLFVISTDLSHFLDYDTARARDAKTALAIENLDYESLEFDQACGRTPVAGMLLAAKKNNLSIHTLDLKNSGDTAGPKDRVVGYGAWVLSEPANALQAEGPNMLSLARYSIKYGLKHHHQPPKIDLAGLSVLLRKKGACFVSLHLNKQLRGCIGSLQATRPLGEDLIANACAAAFSDPRFPPLTEANYANIELEISVLGEPTEMAFSSESDLLQQLQPGKDGLILQAGERRSTFLPVVWESLPKPEDFLQQLRLKAGLEKEYWSEDLRLWRYRTTFTHRGH